MLNVFFLPSWCPKIPSFIISFLFREIHLAILSGQVCWWQLVLVFLHLRVFGFPSIPQEHFTGYRIPFDIFFLSVLESFCAISSGSSGFWWEIYDHLDPFPLLVRCVFFWILSRIFFALVFRSLMIRCLGFILFGICLASCICRLCLLQNLRHFQPFSLGIFQAHPLSPLLLRLQWHKC